ncbi:MAG: AMP-binding protein, partial [Burkholderiales bacterium]
MNAYSFFARGFTARLGHDFSFGADEDYTYADLARDTARVARWLTVQGLRGGERVLAIVEPSRSSIVAYLGCLRAGAVWVPVAASSSKSEIERVTELTEPRLALSAAQISALDETVADKDPDEPAITRFKPARVLDETPAAILWAPGGRGVMLSHWHLMEDARLAAETWKIDATDAIVHRAPITDRF